jgi:hypothetical protein
MTRLTELYGKKVILIGIGFYDYENEIVNELEKYGAKVHSFQEIPTILTKKSSSWIGKIPRGSSYLYKNHARNLISQIKSIPQIDHIIVLQCSNLDNNFFREVRDAHPEARMALYQWDSMARFPSLRGREEVFDAIFTFDCVDADNNSHLTFRPNFYRREMLEIQPQKTDVDIAFVGWLHHDRLRLLREIDRQAKELGLSFFYYLYTGHWTAAKLRAVGKGAGVHTAMLSFAGYAEIVGRAKVLVDLPHPHQSGLSMRVLDCLAARRKLITTSPGVANYDFYCADNIDIIDYDHPVISEHFIGSGSFVSTPPGIENYSLSSWLEDIIGLSSDRPFLKKPG